MEKRTCELFAGVGGFRLGLERLESGWKTIWFSQWEPGVKVQHAHDVYVSRFGDCVDSNGELHTNEDVSGVDKTAIPDFDLLTAGFPCLSGETLVQTATGLKPIESITVGEKVLSHDGRYHEVLRTACTGTKRTYRMKGYGFDELFATGNHMFLVRRRRWKFKRIDGKSRRFQVLEPPKWMTVSEMFEDENPRDLFLATRMSEAEVLPEWNGAEIHVNQFVRKTIRDLKMNDETLWYLAGRYLGDGWLRKQTKKGELRDEYVGIAIACNKDETDDFIKKLNGSFKCTIANERTVTKVIFSSVELAAFMKQFGIGAKNKGLPGFAFDLPVEYAKKLIEGYLDSDGCVSDGNLQFTTISRILAYGIATLCEKAYGKPCAIRKYKTKEYKFIEGRKVRQNDFYLVRCKTNDKHRTYFYEDGFMWRALNEITESDEVPVYDVEIEESHTFIANRVVTHNCQSYSVAASLASSTGIEGGKGELWWQIRDVLEAKRPPFCLFENVDRLLKSPAKQRGRDFGIILSCLNVLGYSAEWRVVDASDYGGAQRRRRTFIFAYEKGTAYAERTRDLTERELVEKSGFMARAFPIAGTSEPTTAILPERPLDASDSFAFRFENAGIMRNGEILTEKIEPKREAPITLGEILESDVPEKYYATEEQKRKFEYMKGSKRFLRTAKNGHEYVYSEGAMACPDPLDRPARTLLTSEGSTSRTSHVIEDPETGRWRKLTPLECERIQGFDDDWTKGIPDGARRFCMGNALVVPMVTRMGKVLDEIVAEEA